MRTALLALVAARCAGAAHAPARPVLVLSRPETQPPSHSATSEAAGAVLRLRGGVEAAATSYGVLSLLPPVIALIASVALKQARAAGRRLGCGPFSLFSLSSMAPFLPHVLLRHTRLKSPASAQPFGATFQTRFAPQVIVALLLGVFGGCLLLHRGNILLAAARTFDSYFVDALADRDHAGVVLFTLLLGEAASPRARTLVCRRQRAPVLSPSRLVVPFTPYSQKAPPTCVPST
jgi:hypothetical protein